MTKEEIKQLLLLAERQYQHNDCSGLLRGYDYEKVIEILSSQLEPLVIPKIAEGDLVNVFFDTQDALFGYKVNYVPSATGDCWHLSKDDKVAYVQNFNLMEKTEEPQF